MDHIPRRLLLIVGYLVFIALTYLVSQVPSLPLLGQFAPEAQTLFQFAALGGIVLFVLVVVFKGLPLAGG